MSGYGPQFRVIVQNSLTNSHCWLISTSEVRCMQFLGIKTSSLWCCPSISFLLFSLIVVGNGDCILVAENLIYKASGLGIVGQTVPYQMFSFYLPEWKNLLARQWFNIWVEPSKWSNLSPIDWGAGVKRGPSESDDYTAVSGSDCEMSGSMWGTAVMDGVPSVHGGREWGATHCDRRLCTSAKRHGDLWPPRSLFSWPGSERTFFLFFR